MRNPCVGIHLWPTSGLPGVRACLLVADDGRGFCNEPPATSGRGIPLARHLVGRCGPALTREPGGPGTVWRAELAAAEAAERGADREENDRALAERLCASRCSPKPRAPGAQP